MRLYFPIRQEISRTNCKNLRNKIRIEYTSYVDMNEFGIKAVKRCDGTPNRSRAAEYSD